MTDVGISRFKRELKVLNVSTPFWYLERPFRILRDQKGVETESAGRLYLYNRTSSFFTFIERRWQTLRARGAGDDLRYT